MNINTPPTKTFMRTGSGRLCSVVVILACFGLALITSGENAVASHLLDPDALRQPAASQIEQLESATDGPLSLLNIVAILASIAILFILRQAWRTRPRLTDIQQTSTTNIPEQLHPAYAGMLASGRVRDSQLEALVLQLIQRGTLLLEPDANEGGKVQIRIIDRDNVDNPPERQLLELLQQRESDGVVSYRQLKRLRNNWDNVRAQLQRDGADRGWLNPSGMQTRLPFLLPGFIGLALAIAMIIAAIVSGNGWPVLGAIFAGGSGLIVLSAGSVIPYTTLEGERAAVPWRGLRAGLLQARDNADGTLDLDLLFPYIVAMGLAAQYDRPLRRASQSGYIPTWIGRRKRVQKWPEGWHTYWLALHTALAPTDPVNTTAPSGSAWRRSLTGGR